MLLRAFPPRCQVEIRPQASKPQQGYCTRSRERKQGDHEGQRHAAQRKQQLHPKVLGGAGHRAAQLGMLQYGGQAGAGDERAGDGAAGRASMPAGC